MTELRQPTLTVLNTSKYWEQSLKRWKPPGHLAVIGIPLWHRCFKPTRPTCSVNCLTAAARDWFIPCRDSTSNMWFAVDLDTQHLAKQPGHFGWWLENNSQHRWIMHDIIVYNWYHWLIENNLDFQSCLWNLQTIYVTSVNLLIYYWFPSISTSYPSNPYGFGTHQPSTAGAAADPRVDLKNCQLPPSDRHKPCEPGGWLRLVWCDMLVIVVDGQPPESVAACKAK